MKKNGLTISVVFEAESANYGEGFGNISVLKKLSRGDGNSYSYISRQALRYNIVKEAEWDTTPVDRESGVVQYEPLATIKDYPEIDFFGYLKTSKKADGVNDGSNKRNAVARLSNAIALEAYNADLDFLTNMGLAARRKLNNDISQSEIHKSFYAYTLTIDLDLVGVDGEIVLSSEEKSARVKTLLKTIRTLYRDIKGRRENLSPLFVVGGLYEVKCPFFENRIRLEKNKLSVSLLNNAIEEAGAGTMIGYADGTFANNEEIKAWNPLTVGAFFESLNKEIEEYYA